MSKKSFIAEFVKENKMVGSMIPSSRFLKEKMLGDLHIADASVIVELGPGTGVFTEHLSMAKGDKTQMIVIELNDTFYETVSQTYKNDKVDVIHGSATDLLDILKQRNLSKADLIVSSLPLANLDKALRKEILSTIYQALSDSGVYVQFQYTLQSKKTLKAMYGQVDIKFTPLNFPPAFVYHCRKS